MVKGKGLKQTFVGKGKEGKEVQKVVALEGWGPRGELKKRGGVGQQTGGGKRKGNVSIRGEITSPARLLGKKN